METDEGPYADRYALKKLVSYGSHGFVCIAHDLVLNRTVAVKTPSSPEGESIEDRNARVRKEAEIAARLQHPNIVRLLDFNFTHAGQEDEGKPFLVFDYIQGEPVSDFAKRTRPSMARIVDIGIQIARALHYIHSQSPPIVHRDIRGENVLITKDGKVFLIDWSVSRCAGTIVTTMGPKGTRPYMAPEVADLELSRTPKDGKMRIDGRADLYSLGILLFQLVTGKIPYEPPKSIVDFREMLRTVKIDPPSKHRKECPPAFDQLVAKLVAHDREKRFESAADVAEELQSISLDVGRPLVTEEIEGVAPTAPLNVDVSLVASGPT